MTRLAGHQGLPLLRFAAAAIRAGTRLVYPPQCLSCGTLTDQDFALCGPCWRDMPFISGACCQFCGLPVRTAGPEMQAHLSCEDCHSAPPPWYSGRAAMLYSGTGRRLVLALKHGDRLDLARPMGRWLARAATPLLLPETLILAVPMHRWRLLRRRYNQAALLARALAAATGHPCCPDALIRPRYTAPLEGQSRAARFARLSGSILASRRGAGLIRGRPVLIVDDVMTSGATLSAASLACYAAGAERVSVLPLARVAKET